MTHPTIITQEQWNAMTTRIFAGVGTKIRQTRRIQHGLRYVISAVLVVFTFFLYAVALITQ